MKKVYRYYCPFRPPMPGAIPRKGLVNAHEFESQETIHAVGAWGYVEYDRPLTEQEIIQYELSIEGGKTMNAFKKIEACVSFEYSEEDLKDILITALEGGIGYWACLRNDTDDYKDQPKDMPTSEWCWELLKRGKPIEFIDEEEDGENENNVVIYLDDLYDGIRGAIENRVWDGDMNSLDALVADAIVQYAWFGDVIYG